jgi:hypothetical protein
MARVVQADTDPWWNYDDEGEHARSISVALGELHRIQELEAFRREMDRQYVRWYGDPRYNGFTTVGPAYPSPNNYDESQSNENVIREILTTLHNKFAKNKPVPTVVTLGGTWEEQEEAQERELWIRGVFEEDRVYDMLSQSQFASMCFCDGFIGVRDDYDVGRPVGYTIAPYEVHLDPPEGANGKPRTIYIVGTENKDVLGARFPEEREAILNATPFFEEFWNIRQWNADTRQVNYLECWHLPSGKNAGDGRHIIGVQNATLVNEPWDFDYFPLVKMPWNPRPFGYFSVGLIEDLIGPQRQLNKVRNAIDEHLKLLSSSFWAVARGSQVIKSHLSNLIGRVLEYTTAAPELKTPEPVSANLLQHQGELRNQVFAQSGVSQMSSQAMKPAGLNSGKALRVYSDQEDQRFTNAYLAKEQAVVDLANLYSRRAQAMLDSGNDTKLSVRLTKDSQLREVEWKDADLDSFRVQVLPASSLSTTLAGRIEDVEDLEGLGLITDTDQKRQLLQIPDLKADSDLSLAPRNLILRTLQTTILKKGEPITPEPYWPLQQCATLGLQVLCYAQLKGYPQDRIQLLQNWVNECAARIQQAQQPPPSAPQQVPPGMPPGAPPSPGPIGELPTPAGPMPGASP